MVRHYYGEWGRGRERTERAARELGPMLDLRVGLHKQLGSFFPFGDDWMALNATLDHLNRLATHFGLPVAPERHPYKAPASRADFANGGQ